MELLRQSTQQFVDNFINNNELTTNINSLWADFHSFVISAQDIYVPSKWSSIRYTQPWFTTDCKKLVRKKKKLYCKAKKSNQNADWQAFKDAVVKTRKACREAYNIFINNCLDKNNNSNSKRLFSYIKSKQIDNIGVAPLKDNGLVYINGHDKARILNSQFVNVFSIDKGDIPQIHAKYAENPMNNFNINSEGIIKLLNQLNSKQKRTLTRKLHRSGMVSLNDVQEEARNLLALGSSSTNCQSTTAATPSATTVASTRSSSDTVSPPSTTPMKKKRKGATSDWSHLPTEERLRREDQRRKQKDAAERRRLGVKNISTSHNRHRHPLNSERRRANRRKPKWNKKNKTTTMSSSPTSLSPLKQEHHTSGYHMRRNGTI